MKSFVPDRERDLVLALVIGKIDKDQLSEAFGGDPRCRAAEWLQRSVREHDGLGAELALALGHTFGFEGSDLPWLLELAVADWHPYHENVVDALAKLAAPESVDVLYQTARAKFPYRDYDDAQSLGVKCVWALYRVGTVEAVGRLHELILSDEPILADLSKEMLQQLARESISGAVRDAAERALT